MSAAPGNDPRLLDWKIPGTPGVNRVRSSVDAAGTITLVQIDSERIESTFLAPWVRIGDAEGQLGGRDTDRDRVPTSRRRA